MQQGRGGANEEEEEKEEETGGAQEEDLLFALLSQMHANEGSDHGDTEEDDGVGVEARASQFPVSRPSPFSQFAASQASLTGCVTLSKRRSSMGLGR